MNNRDLKKMIKAKAIESMPEVIGKIDLETIEIIPETTDTQNATLNHSRVLSYLVAAFAVMVITVLGTFVFSNPGTDMTPLETDAEIIGFQSVSAVSLLEGIEVEELSLKLTTSTEATEPDVTETEIETIDQYLNMFELTLGNKENITYETVVSDREEYAFSIQFHGIDLTNVETSYKLYYNQSQLQEGLGITGIFTTGDKEFPIVGTIYQNDTITRSTFRAAINNENYVVVRDISTDKGQLFRYRIVQNGVITNESDITLVAQRGSFTANMQLTIRGRELNLTINKTAEEPGFSIDYEITNDSFTRSGNIDVTVEFDQALNKYVYRYRIVNSRTTDETTYQGNRPGRTNPNPGTTTTIPTTDNPGSGGASTDNPGSGNTDNPGPGPFGDGGPVTSPQSKP